MAEMKRGASIRCQEKGCNGNPKKLIQATTFVGTICERCWCVHEYEPSSVKEPEITEEPEIENVVKENSIEKKPKTKKKKTIKQLNAFE